MLGSRIRRCLLILTCLVVPNLAAAVADENDLGPDYETPTLRPVHINDYEIATGVVRRNGPDLLDEMKPTNEAHLSYGSPTG
jgi:hypothetical protein